MIDLEPYVGKLSCIQMREFAWPPGFLPCTASRRHHAPAIVRVHARAEVLSDAQEASVH